MVDLFERKLAEYTGFRHAVAVDCCTNALLISLVAKRIWFEEVRRVARTHLNMGSITVPRRTYLSVPMMLMNNGFKFRFTNTQWKGFYELGNTAVFDAATDLRKFMRADYSRYFGRLPFVCVSFQQKKRLSLGRGGAILLDDPYCCKILRRLRHDGRESRMTVSDELASNPDRIILGYHCYMDPEKAAVGIAKLNQLEDTTKYAIHTSMEYPDISKLKFWKGRNGSR